MTLPQRCMFSKGDIIGGRYTVTRTLGEGSFGMVYAVGDRNRNGCQFALKLLKLWEVSPEIRDSLVSRFDMEFETGRIDSDYLVHSVSHGMEQGNPYIVMEYCPKGDLVDLNNSESIDYSTVAVHVLRGLKALHRNGKVHRDLKPENVLLKPNGKFALTDFGISGDRNKRMTELNIFGTPKQIFGTYAYMPPEQLKPQRDATVLPTTDIFSFGVMMYQLLTGHMPFGTLNSESDLPAYLRNGKAGKWDRDRLRHVDALWLELIEGCLEPNFRNRIQTTDEALNLVPQKNSNVSAHIATVPDFPTRIVNGVLLRIMQGEEFGHVYYLDRLLSGDRSILLMGRKDSYVHNDIEITEEHSSYISRCHCTLELDYNVGSWVIRDGQWDRNTSGGGWRGSTNGTYVNSREVSSDEGMKFSPGDIISIGDTKLRVEAY